MTQILKAAILTALITTTSQGFAFNLKQGSFLLEAGAYYSSQGENQNINIQGLVGDHFSVTDHNDVNALFGLGYLIHNGSDKQSYGFDYGINAFYLAPTTVKGLIAQELLFCNLGYSYKVSHLPVYATAKTHIMTYSNKYVITLDGGIGPNFISSQHYRDWSIDGGITLPDRAFNSRTNVTFSAMAGVGVKVANLFGQHPVECGYRFFYLGQGRFHKRNNELVNSLKTGPSFANALLCSVTI